MAEADAGLRKVCEGLMARPGLDYARMNAAAAAGTALPAQGSPPTNPSVNPPRKDWIGVRAAGQAFVGRNVERLFPKRAAAAVPSEAAVPTSSMPTLECFLDLPREREAEKTFGVLHYPFSSMWGRVSSESFLKDLREGDVVIAKLRSSDDSGLIARLLCTAGHRFRRDLHSLNIDVGHPASPPRNWPHHGVPGRRCS